MSGPVPQHPYVEMDAAAGALSLMPLLPLTLTVGQRTVAATGLLDTGAAINVAPRTVGLQLGAVWDQQTTPVRLTGALAGIDARVLIVSAQIDSFAPVRLAFAWASTDAMPLILGQTNFFQEFDVCFFRTRSFFEIRIRS